ncbi:MAG: hypothetical protein ABSH09_30905 [Bryobacteraceae bacterium]
MLDDRMVDELNAIIAELGGESALGRALNTDVDLRSAIREGFPKEVVDSVLDSANLTLKDLSQSLNLSRAASSAAAGRAASPGMSQTASTGWPASLRWPSTTSGTRTERRVG